VTHVAGDAISQRAGSSSIMAKPGGRSRCGPCRTTQEPEGLVRLWGSAGNFEECKPVTGMLV
jgi:hypothetical protein